MAPVLLVTGDLGLRETVARLAALAGTPVHVEPPGPAAGAARRTAGLVVLGADVADLAGPRRDGVVLVCDREPGPEIWQRAVAVGAEQVLVLPADEPRLLDLMVEAGEPPRPRGLVLGVVGGCGGAGGSTLSAALGLAARASGPAVLLDADPLGGGLDLLLAAEHQPGARWSDLAATRGRLSAASLLDALPVVDGLAVLSWDRGVMTALAVEAAASVLDASARAAATVVIDLPRQLDPAAEALAAGCEDVLVLVPSTVQASAAAARVVSRFAGVTTRPGLVVRDAGPPRLAADDIAAVLGLPLRGTLCWEAGIAAAARQGRPPFTRPRGSLYESCRRILTALASDRVAA